MGGLRGAPFQQKPHQSANVCVPGSRASARTARQWWPGPHSRENAAAQSLRVEPVSPVNRLVLHDLPQSLQRVLVGSRKLHYQPGARQIALFCPRKRLGCAEKAGRRKQSTEFLQKLLRSSVHGFQNQTWAHFRTLPSPVVAPWYPPHHHVSTRKSFRGPSTLRAKSIFSQKIFCKKITKHLHSFFCGSRFRLGSGTLGNSILLFLRRNEIESSRDVLSKNGS